MNRHYAFFLASRHRAALPKGVQPDLSPETKDHEVQHIRAMLIDLREQHGESLVVVGLGGDCNFGLRVRLLCNQMGIGFAEYMLNFNEHLPKPFFEEFFFGRHGALMDLLEGASANTTATLYFFLGRSRYTHIEDMISRVRQSGRAPYYIYAEDNTVLETNHAAQQQLAAG